MISNRRTIMPKCKTMDIFSFLALLRAPQEFHCYLKISKDFLIFVTPHSGPYLQSLHLLLNAYIFYEKWANLSRIRSKENFSPDMKNSCVIILSFLIEVLVRFCGSTIWQDCISLARFWVSGYPWLVDLIFQ